MLAREKKEGSDSIWIIVLKTVAYLIGLLLGGIGTTASAHMLSIL